MKEKKEEKDEILSLNKSLYDDFYVQELEERLETDPLGVGGLLDFFAFSENGVEANSSACGELSCGCYQAGFIGCRDKS